MTIFMRDQRPSRIMREPKADYAGACFAICIFIAVVCAVPPALDRFRGDLDCSRCHSAEIQKRDRLAEYFSNAGSPEPRQMAEAVLATKRPRLMAAIAKVESGGNPHIRATGYKRRHDGAWQVNRRWGAVSDSPVEQALQAEAVLCELTGDRPLAVGLNRYGGDKTRKRYAQNVLRELQEVPK